MQINVKLCVCKRTYHTGENDVNDILRLKIKLYIRKKMPITVENVLKVTKGSKGETILKQNVRNRAKLKTYFSITTNPVCSLKQMISGRNDTHHRDEKSSTKKGNYDEKQSVLSLSLYVMSQ